MQDLLDMPMDQIADVVSTQHRKNTKKDDRRQVNPFDHYEVQCARLETVYIGEEYSEANAVYSNVQSSAKALIHVRGKLRLVLATNAPYQYSTGKLVYQPKETHESARAL